MPRRVIIPDRLIIQPLNEEAVMLELGSETYYSLNGSAYHMWQVLTSTATIEDALEQLFAYYDVDQDLLRREFEVFLDELRQHQLIGVTDD